MFVELILHVFDAIVSLLSSCQLPFVNIVIARALHTRSRNENNIGAATAPKNPSLDEVVIKWDDEEFIKNSRRISS